jgi:predicted DNA binding CopG/RHH family protein
MSVEQILAFLEDFRALTSHTADDGPSQLISIKVPPSLLRAFKAKAQANGLKYQTQIKSLMKAWLLG